MKIRPKITPPFNSERLLKSTLSNSMLSDANDFLWRVDIVKSNSDFFGISFISKIYVELLMAVESDLKSLIISLSLRKETPEDAYMVARNCGHDISKLYSEVEKRAKNRITLLKLKDKNELLEKATQIKVSNRYKLISLLKIKTDDPLDRLFGVGKYSSLLTYEYISDLEKIALKLHQISSKSSKRYLDMVAMNGRNIGKYERRVNQFKEKLGKKL
ncbi:hypothetical protein LVD15_10125 [Fulvivirga maritima]|uniref:hypothetical protein n=1 Tax=Fulvivirga maritima TaxID=2904247 RepID=UPI001F429634|nr:hypothetical protein [Fulvivirga maritima]UII28758.1 hypothetical protein LVD15_10125 [Fulvivirga maritima]